MKNPLAHRRLPLGGVCSFVFISDWAYRSVLSVAEMVHFRLFYFASTLSGPWTPLPFFTLSLKLSFSLFLCVAPVKCETRYSAAWTHWEGEETGSKKKTRMSITEIAKERERRRGKGGSQEAKADRERGRSRKEADWLTRPPTAAFTRTVTWSAVVEI